MQLQRVPFHTFILIAKLVPIEVLSISNPQSLLTLTGIMKVGRRELFDYSPASRFKPGQTTTLMSLPEEIRSLIYSFLVEPQFKRLLSGRTRIDWQSRLVDGLPEDMRNQGLQAYYGRKKLIIDLPDFEPHSLRGVICNGVYEYEWPSEIHFHDQHNELSFWVVPSFFSQVDPDASASKYVNHHCVQECPSYRFSEMIINIPPPKSGDMAQLIMNWNRLRCIRHILAGAFNRKTFQKTAFKPDSKGLPPVKIVFLEDHSTGRSWFDVNQNLIRSNHPGIAPDKGHEADLLTLLRALTPVRGSPLLTIEPSLPESVRQRSFIAAFSAAWIANPEAQKHRFGEYMDAQCDDLKAYTWLTGFEVLFHRVLHELDTPIAPFLRLEQMASVSHFDFSRLSHFVTLNRRICKTFEPSLYFLLAVQYCSFTLSPWEGRGVCRCRNSPGAKIDMDHILRSSDGSWMPRDTNVDLCLRNIHWTDYRTNFNEWKEEFIRVQTRLRNANATAQSDNLEVILDQIARFDLRPYSESTTALEFHHSKSPSKSMCCACYIPMGPDGQVREAWIHEWQDGIIHDEQTLRSCEAVHWCRRLPSFDSDLEASYLSIVKGKKGKAREDVYFIIH